MPLPTQPSETDLWLPRPSAGERWDPHTVHTYYFGFCVPEAELGVFIYLRSQPVYGLSSGGVGVFAGLDNRLPLGVAHLDMINTMPYPEIVDGVITTMNGLRIEFGEPGRVIRLRYTSADGRCSFDVTQTAVTPLLRRGHVMPGEDADTDRAQQPGGSEQFLRCTGELVVEGDRFAVDCHAIRDRSWRQVRTEREVVHPPVGWSPMYFGADLVFNQIGFESPDTSPPWKGLYDVVHGAPTFHFGWALVDGEPRTLRSVHRSVTRRHPDLFAALEQDIEAVDETGARWRFHGTALAMAHLPSWPNNFFVDSVYRWEDTAGRVSHGTYQEAWYRRFHRAMTVS
ncbi:MAG TPA: tyrosine protein kinase [Acidimicrobiia bacterium]|nr:tyrosine protein kinase [Acidimicrobiia bacterium]